MAIIGNQWAQDAGQFGQQTGNALAQGLLQLPQERYQLALQAQNQQQALQQMAMMQQYRQGQLGIRQQQANTQQQGLDMRNQNDQMANQIRMLMAQVAMGNEQNRQNAPLVVPAGASIYNRNSLNQEQPQQNSPDYGPWGDQPPQGNQLQQNGVSPMATAPQKQPVFKPNTLTPNAAAHQQDSDTLNYMGLLSHTNMMQQNPQLATLLSNRVFSAQAPQTGGVGMGQQTTNSLQQNPPNPQTGGRPISRGVAQLFLQKANGDKNLARQMARQAGFAF
jgi:hypothetical protein